MSVFIRGWPAYVSTHATSVLVTPPTTEPLSIAEVKQRARISTSAEDGLIRTYIKAARDQVEQDTGLALLTQTRDVYLDSVPAGITPFALPWPPLQSVTSVKYTDTGGIVQTLAASNYVWDASSMPARLALSDVGVWPTDIRVFQPWVIRIVVGWTNPALIPPALLEAVGILAVHMATFGRDLVSVGNTVTPMLQSYHEKIAAYSLVRVA